MNAINAIAFVIMGSGAGLLPVLFPSWFPPTGADSSSARVLWLDFMATVEVSLGIAYLVWYRLVPYAGRLVAALRASDAGAVALSKPRGIPGH